MSKLHNIQYSFFEEIQVWRKRYKYFSLTVSIHNCYQQRPNITTTNISTINEVSNIITTGTLSRQVNNGFHMLHVWPGHLPYQPAPLFKLFLGR